MSKKPQYRGYNELDNDEVTVLYIVAMLISSVFRGNWIFWIIFTIAWAKHMAKYK